MPKLTCTYDAVPEGRCGTGVYQSIFDSNGGFCSIHAPCKKCGETPPPLNKGKCSKKECKKRTLCSALGCTSTVQEKKLCYKHWKMQEAAATAAAAAAVSLPTSASGMHAPPTNHAYPTNILSAYTPIAIMNMNAPVLPVVGVMAEVGDVRPRLMTAASTQNIAELQALLPLHGTPAHVKDKAGNNLLCILALSTYPFREECSAIAELLIRAGVDILATNNNGDTSVALAAQAAVNRRQPKLLCAMAKIAPIKVHGYGAQGTKKCIYLIITGLLLRRMDMTESDAQQYRQIVGDCNRFACPACDGSTRTSPLLTVFSAGNSMVMKILKDFLPAYVTLGGQKQHVISAVLCDTRGGDAVPTACIVELLDGAPDRAAYYGMKSLLEHRIDAVFCNVCELEYFDPDYFESKSLLQIAAENALSEQTKEQQKKAEGVVESLIWAYANVGEKYVDLNSEGVRLLLIRICDKVRSEDRIRKRAKLF